MAVKNVMLGLRVYPWPRAEFCKMKREGEIRRLAHILRAMKPAGAQSEVAYVAPYGLKTKPGRGRH